MGGLPAPQFTEDVGRGETGVHDVLDQDHVPVVDIVVQVLHDPDPARPLGVGRDAQEVDLTGNGHVTDQVGQEEEAALQDGHEQHTAGIGMAHVGAEPGGGPGQIATLVEDPGGGAPRHPPS